MTSNTNRDPALKYNRQPASGLFRIVSGTLLARFVITAVLLVGLLLTGEESEPFPAIATRTADTAQAASRNPCCWPPCQRTWLTFRPKWMWPRKTMC